jgi:hypothetical protein
MKTLMTLSKRLTLAIVVVSGSLVMSTTSKAQVGFAIGPKAGLSITSYQGDGAGNVTARANWVAGAFANIQIIPAFCIQPELLISQKGASQTKGFRTNDINVTYFDVPILAKIRLPIQNVFFPHVLIGPDFAYNIGASYSSVDTRTGLTITTSTTNISKSDVGGLVGLGFDIQSRSIFFTFDARYGFGFSNLGDDTYNLNFKNSGWTFAAGIGFRIGD